MLTKLTCPVCGMPLTKTEKTYCCPSAHSYDIARQGYVNLLTQGAGQHGDNKEMVVARNRFLCNGFYENLGKSLAIGFKKHLPTGGTLLDIGCGEGYYTSLTKDLFHSVYAFDISKDALKLAAKLLPAATLFVASAYKIPVASAAFDGCMLFFSPFCREEILRVLKPGGIFAMAIPGKKHLWELKQTLYTEPYENEVKEYSVEGFSLSETVHLENNIRLCSQREIWDLFTMTPYFYKTSPSDKKKLTTLDNLTVKTEFELLFYQKK